MRDIAQAWQIAALAVSAWAGKLPPLDGLISNAMRSYERQSGEQQLARLHALGSHIGVSLKPMSESTKRALLRLKES